MNGWCMRYVILFLTI
uniref:Uncharacterized protein n=1 Tax=Arundo donax TaxID=35708 RepID=A0A0A8Y518_ARUDO